MKKVKWNGVQAQHSMKSVVKGLGVIVLSHAWLHCMVSDETELTLSKQIMKVDYPCKA